MAEKVSDDFMETKQSGVALLVFVMALILGVSGVSAIYFVNVQKYNQIKRVMGDAAVLRQAKENLLDYAVMNPEIYATDDDGDPQLMENIPGPGYLPCPDTNNSGSPNTACGGGVVAMGRLPIRIGSRDVVFLDDDVDSSLIWYAVDERFVQNNANYYEDRFSPLNSELAVPPRLTVDGESDIVAVLFFAGERLSGQNGNSNNMTNYLEGENADGDGDFTALQSPGILNDVVVKISYQEWRQAMLKRLEGEKASLCSTIPTAQTVHWFNQCNIHAGGDWRPGCLQDNGEPENPLGANWRGININGTLGCP